MMLVITCVGQANVVTLKFNANDIFNYATSDDSRLNQQGTARQIYDCPTGRYYLTYNDSTRDTDATALHDLQSIANILDWSGMWAGYQGVSHLQLWLNNGANVRNWGEVLVAKPGTLTASADEFGWTTNVSGDIAHFNTLLGLPPDTHNAISPSYNPADNLWTVTGDFYVDVDEDGSYTEGTDEDLFIGQEYTIWFYAANNNWRCVDDYGNDAWGSPDIEGTITATAVAADAITVEIDIKPGSYPNVVNLGSNGVLPIAILSSKTFDATTVDPATVTLKGSDVAVRGKSENALAHEEDVNGDGLLDLVCKVETENLYPGAGYAILTGSTYGDQAIVGQDEIIIVPPE